MLALDGPTVGSTIIFTGKKLKIFRVELKDS